MEAADPEATLAPRAGSRPRGGGAVPSTDRLAAFAAFRSEPLPLVNSSQGSRST